MNSAAKQHLAGRQGLLGRNRGRGGPTCSSRAGLLRSRRSQRCCIAQATTVQEAAADLMGNISSATGLARTSMPTWAPLQTDSQAIVESLETQIQCLKAENQTLMNEKRNAIMREVTLQQETERLRQEVKVSIARLASLAQDRATAEALHKKSLWYSYVESKQRLRTSEDELEDARYQARRQMAAAVEDTNKARQQAAEAQATADLMSRLLVATSQTF